MALACYPLASPLSRGAGPKTRTTWPRPVANYVKVKSNRTDFGKVKSESPYILFVVGQRLKYMKIKALNIEKPNHNDWVVLVPIGSLQHHAINSINGLLTSVHGLQNCSNGHRVQV